MFAGSVATNSPTLLIGRRDEITFAMYTSLESATRANGSTEQITSDSISSTAMQGRAASGQIHWKAYA